MVFYFKYAAMDCERTEERETAGERKTDTEDMAE
jgi:hypothetical protein